MLLSVISRCTDYFIKALVLYGIVENIYYIIRMLDNAFSSRYRVDLIFCIKRASLSSCDLIIHWDWYCSRYDNDRKWKGARRLLDRAFLQLRFCNQWSTWWSWDRGYSIFYFLKRERRERLFKSSSFETDDKSSFNGSVQTSREDQ